MKSKEERHQQRAMVGSWSNGRLFEEKSRLEFQFKGAEARMMQLEANLGYLEGKWGEAYTKALQQDSSPQAAELIEVNARIKEWGSLLTYINNELKARKADSRDRRIQPQAGTWQEQQAYQERMRKERYEAERRVVKGWTTEQLLQIKRELVGPLSITKVHVSNLEELVGRYRNNKNLHANRAAVDDMNRATADLNDTKDRLEELKNRSKAVNLELSLRGWAASRK